MLNRNIFYGLMWFVINSIMDFLETLKARNEALFYFGLLNLVVAIVCLALVPIINTKVLGINAYIKPFKFAASLWIYAWSMGWYCYYLGPEFNIKLFNLAIIILLGFEIVYITFQAAKGELSHFNISSGFYSAMFSIMGLAATLATLYTAYVGFLFCSQQFPDLPLYYVWAIRISIALFVIFSFEGALMGSKLSHSIGGPDGGPGIPILNWSTQHGDPRIAHFIGMHALQVIPIASFYLIKSVKGTIILAALYGLLALYTLLVALAGKSMFKFLN